MVGVCVCASGLLGLMRVCVCVCGSGSDLRIHGGGVCLCFWVARSHACVCVSGVWSLEKFWMRVCLLCSEC